MTGGPRQDGFPALQVAVVREGQHFAPPAFPARDAGEIVRHQGIADAEQTGIQVVRLSRRRGVKVPGIPANLLIRKLRDEARARLSSPH